MSKLTEAARGQECTLQIHPYCNGNAETVVFCHFPSEGHGIALKSPDWWGADACIACHDVIDSRNPQAVRDLGWAEIEKCKWRGMFRTLKRRIEQGLVRVPK
jgi:predicted CxxxxCH...CXXCH cytochrome family protein